MLIHPCQKRGGVAAAAAASLHQCLAASAVHDRRPVQLLPVLLQSDPGRPVRVHDVKQRPLPTVAPLPLLLLQLCACVL